MDTQTAERVRLWLKTSRGDETQEALAEDITTRTGWTITRDRYSRYESGGIPVGSKVLGHFKDYWKGRGVDGPDLTPPPPVEPEPTLPAALMTLAKELRESREDRVRMGGSGSSAGVAGPSTRRSIRRRRVSRAISSS